MWQFFQSMVQQGKKACPKADEINAKLDQEGTDTVTVSPGFFLPYSTPLTDKDKVTQSESDKVAQSAVKIRMKLGLSLGALNELQQTKLTEVAGPPHLLKNKEEQGKAIEGFVKGRRNDCSDTFPDHSFNQSMNQSMDDGST